MIARLIALKTNEELLVLEKPVTRIGRERGYVDLVISDPSISRSHCNIICDNEGFYLIDCNSTNHTYVNGLALKPNERYLLHHKDVIILGCIGIRFEEVG